MVGQQERAHFLAGAGFLFGLLGGAKQSKTYRQHADRVDREPVDVGVAHGRGVLSERLQVLQVYEGSSGQTKS